MKKFFKILIRLSLFGLFIYFLQKYKNCKCDCNCSCNSCEMVREEKEEQKVKEVKQKKTKGVNKDKDVKLSYRQRAVLNIVRAKKRIRMRDLLMRVPGVSERTLRRDLGKLQEANLIEKTGSTKSSFYTAL